MGFYPNLITLPLAFKGICNHTKDKILTYLFRVSGGCGDPSYLCTSQMKTLENIEYLFIPGGTLSSYHQVVTKLHFQTQYPGVSVMICSNYDPAELKVYNVILI